MNHSGGFRLFVGGVWDGSLGAFERFYRDLGLVLSLENHVFYRAFAFFEMSGCELSELFWRHAILFSGLFGRSTLRAIGLYRRVVLENALLTPLIAGRTWNLRYHLLLLLKCKWVFLYFLPNRALRVVRDHSLLLVTVGWHRTFGSVHPILSDIDASPLVTWYFRVAIAENAESAIGIARYVSFLTVLWLLLQVEYFLVHPSEDWSL